LFFFICLPYIYASQSGLKPLFTAGTVILPQAYSADDDSVIYYETFESGAGGWITVDLTDPGPKWHTDDYNAYEGRSWWCADSLLVGYDNNWLQFLITPTLNLSTATDPVLTFKQYIAVEPASVWGVFDGWDGCNVWASVTGGNTWQILYPVSPPYNSQSLYSFGWRWEMGSGVPGWSGYSGGWQEVAVDLSAFTVANVMLRFAFASDEATCTYDDPSLIGYFLDDIQVSDSQSLFLLNDADENAFPAPLVTETGDPSGDYWVLSEDTYHSPNHSWNCDDRYFLSDALVSPPLFIPAGMSTHLSYWVYCDMPDVDGDEDGYLDDYYYIEVSPTGSALWTPLVYDWARDGSQLQWVERTTGYWDNLPTESIDLTPWAGQEIQIRFRTVTDNNNDGGQGEGLYLDDVLLLASVLPENDTGAGRLIIPFPTYEGQPPISCSVDLINYGTADQSQVPAFWSVNGDANALIPWSQVNAGETVTRDFEWSPPAEGDYNFIAYTNLADDEDTSNDTCFAGIVEVTPAGTFEFGYDHRQITYMPDFYSFNFTQGAGPMVYFTPEDDGIPGILYGQTIKAMFYSEGTFTLHIFAEGTEEQPGTEVYSRTVTIGADEIFPNWAQIDISEVEYLQGGHPDFWVWFEITASDYTPHITGHLADAFTPGHFFTYDGFQTTSTTVNFNIRAILTGTTPVEGEGDHRPLSVQLLPNYPNPFNACTRITFTLSYKTDVRVRIYDLTGSLVEELLNGSLPPGIHTVDWRSNTAASGLYILQFQAGDKSTYQKLVLLK
jgi:hypothetical protein